MANAARSSQDTGRAETASRFPRPHGSKTKPFTEQSCMPVALSGPYSEHMLDITYTNDEAVVDEFLQTHLKADSAMGFDLEHKPCYQAGQKANISVMQFAPLTTHTMHPVLVYSLYHNSGLLPRTLLDVLCNPTVRKYGVGIKSDLQHLKYLELPSTSKSSFIELGPMARACGMSDRNGIGLKALIVNCMGLPCTEYKTKKCTMTNWEKRDLDDKQLKYAAMDAYTAVEIFRLLDEKQRLQVSAGHAIAPSTEDDLDCDQQVAVSKE